MPENLKSFFEGGVTGLYVMQQMRFNSFQYPRKLDWYVVDSSAFADWATMLPTSRKHGALQLRSSWWWQSILSTAVKKTAYRVQNVA